MKKTLSLLAMLTVLIGAVTMVTGCGAKPKAGSVWELSKMGELEFPKVQEALGVKITISQLWCFHSDGNLYIKTITKTENSPVAELNGTKAVVMKAGSYSFSGKKATITINGQSETGDYTLKSGTLTFKSEKGDVVLKQSTETEFKN